MKKLILSFCMIACTAFAAQAQKYMTRTGNISFFSSTPIENIEARNNEVACIVDAGSGDVVIQALVKSFKFEKELMREHFNEDYMESDKFPKSEFKGKVANMNEVNLTKDGTYKAKVNGSLTIHGVTKSVSTNGTITVSGGSMKVNAKFTILLADYNIKIASMAAGKISKQIDITIDSDLAKK